DGDDVIDASKSVHGEFYGEGDDDVIYAPAGGPDVFTSDVVVHGGPGNDTLTGGYGGDYLNGDAGHDVVRGGPGHDSVISGLGGRDVLDGGSGHDTLRGGAGLDTCTTTDQDLLWSCERP